MCSNKVNIFLGNFIEISFRRKNLDEHIKQCGRVPCAHKKYGCTFEGTKDKAALHLQQCPYEQIKGNTPRYLGNTQGSYKYKLEHFPKFVGD
jgi:hypothetical protein